MQKSTNPFLIISSFLVVFLSSCANRIVKGFVPTGLESGAYHVPYFSNSETDYVYKANISFYGNEQSGIFVAKKINDSLHRVVFTTEFGNKILDFEVSDHSFKVNFILDALNKKVLIKTLKTDFRLLLREQYTVKKQFEHLGDRIYESRDGKRNDYLFIAKSNGKLHRILRASERKEKIDISFTSENNIIADKIIIEHKNIKLRMELNYFNSLK